MQSEKQYADTLRAATNIPPKPPEHLTWGARNKLTWLISPRSDLKPNDLGNYRGKRKARPTPVPLSPSELFANLQQMYLEKRRDYRFLRTPKAA